MEDSKFSSRKFILTLIILALATWMRFRNVLSDESTLSLLVATVFGYQGSNVADKYIEGKK